jgi:translation initiation factor 2D
LTSQSQGPDDEHAEVTHESSVSAEDAAVDISGSHPDVHNEVVEEITDGVHELELPEKETTEQQSEEKGHPNLTTEEVDSLLNKCLLQALYTSIKEKDLPFPGSTLWYVCLLQFTPEYILLSD